MKTLEDIVRNLKARKGKSTGITEQGAYWNAWPEKDSPTVASIGGDGIGSNAADTRIYLRARHYRFDKVEVGVVVHSWHQNHGITMEWIPVQHLETAVTAEWLISKLQGLEINGYCTLYVRPHRAEEIEKFLASFGLPVAPASPDESAS